MKWEIKTWVSSLKNVFSFELKLNVKLNIQVANVALYSVSHLKTSQFPGERYKVVNQEHEWDRLILHNEFQHFIVLQTEPRT